MRTCTILVQREQAMEQRVHVEAEEVGIAPDFRVLVFEDSGQGV